MSLSFFHPWAILKSGFPGCESSKCEVDEVMEVEDSVSTGTSYHRGNGSGDSLGFCIEDFEPDPDEASSSNPPQGVVILENGMEEGSGHVEFYDLLGAFPLAESSYDATVGADHSVEGMEARDSFMRELEHNFASPSLMEPGGIGVSHNARRLMRRNWMMRRCAGDVSSKAFGSSASYGKSKRARVVGTSETPRHNAAAAGGSGSATSPSLNQFISQGTSFQSGIANAVSCDLGSVPVQGHDEFGGEGSDGDGNGNGNESDLSMMDDNEVRMDLTDDLLHMVFSFLGPTDLCRAAGVCKQWRAASSHEDFWKCLDFENKNITQLQFADMCRRYPNATRVNVLGAPAVENLVQEALTSLRNIQVLIIGKGYFGETFFHALVGCPALVKLDITEATLGNGMHETSVYHEKLQHLRMTKCRVMHLSIRCPQLETLSLKRTNMTRALLSCPLLLELDLAFCNKLSDPGIRALATSCPLLASLGMSNCACVSDETLREISFACPNLHVLDVSYCPNISLESVELPGLTNLNLRNCDGINSLSMTALAICYMLESLQLDCCWLLTSVNLELPRLQKISLVQCKKLIDLNLRCPALWCVTICNCPVLSRINITSQALKKLVLQKQEKLTSVLLQCHQLQEVDFTECESLTNIICEVFCDGGGCPMLRSLVLDSCESLTRVTLRSTSLSSLSLIACRAMKSLKLECPNLQQIFLDGCDHLEDASFLPVGLELLNLGICPKLNVLRLDAPKMEVLELKGCGVLSEASISCPNLRSLDASFCSQLKDDFLSATTASCPEIETLILMSCQLVGPEGLSSLSRLAKLTSLDLSYTFLTSLEPIFEACLQLKVLKLQACKYLDNSSLDPLHKGAALPYLHELDLSYGSICQSAIEELLACCTHLTHVSLNGCKNMHDLDWRSGDSQIFKVPSSADSPIRHSSEMEWDSCEQSDCLLENLNFVGCENIKKVVIPASARCVHLSALNLSLSMNLKEVVLACCNLIFLNLSNCCSLEILKLDCPRLSSLLLPACGIDDDVLEGAIAQCPMLETLDIRNCPQIAGTGNLRMVCPNLKRLFNSSMV